MDHKDFKLHKVATCMHSFHPQTRFTPLPPLYFTPFASTSLPLCTHRKLEQAYHDMGNPSYRSPKVMEHVIEMKKRLEKGMDREDTVKVRDWVGALTERERAVAELFLMRYRGFEMREDGVLDYGLNFGELDETEVERDESWTKVISCTVM
ncbi:hypothetical protein BGZ60DRAFT_114000 [Tricladium varicosporioides]|nr:hypothetical protein BGZ60DRAFT_114000 [Hymenoscyphus varicosporioides]